MFVFSIFIFFFNDTATTEIYTLSLHDALPILPSARSSAVSSESARRAAMSERTTMRSTTTSMSCLTFLSSAGTSSMARSEEHTSELQSRQYLVCRLLLEKKKKKNITLTDLHEY